MKCLEEIVQTTGVHDRGIRFVSHGGTDEYLSYSQLAQRGSAFADYLDRCGVGPAEAVGVILGNDAPSVVAVLGSWSGGRTVVSIPPPGRGIAATSYREGFSQVLAELPCRHVFGPRRARIAFGEDIAYHDLHEVFTQLDLRPLDRELEVPHDALVQFTSGSSSLPRGVVINKVALAGHLATIGQALELSQDDMAVSWLPLHHDMGFIGFLMCALWTRCSLTLMDPVAFVRNPLRWLDICGATGATITGAPNFAYRLLAQRLERQAPSAALNNLRVCLAGAERISAGTLDDFATRAAPAGFRRTALMPVYGLAEATLGACFPPLGRGPVEGPDDMVSVGAPLPGVELRLRPADVGNRCHVDLRGNWMFDEYVTGAGRTRCRDADGWFRTADVAVTAGDELFIVGRDDEAVICRGQNVYAEDLEAIVWQQIGGSALAVAAFTPSVGADEFVVVVELARGQDAPRGLAYQVESAIAGALGVGVKEVLFCRPRTLPLTTSGKVRRAECRALYSSADWPGERSIHDGRC